MSSQPGRELLINLKRATGPCLSALSLPVGPPLEAILRPVATQKGRLNANDVRVLSEWRNRFVTAFLTEFQANESRTERWLTDIVGPDDTRILFMVDDASGRTIGYMGLAFINWERGAVEADAVVRGAETVPGLMTRALRTLLEWARSQLGLPNLGVRVRSDNTALEFYRKFGFKEVRRVPLRRIEESDLIRWVEDPTLPPGEPSLVHMALSGGI